MVFCYIVADEFDMENSVKPKEEQYMESNNEKQKKSYYLVLEEIRFIS